MKKYKGPPQCDECHEFLTKDFVMAFDGTAITVWVCEKSEMWQFYQKAFKKRYHLPIK